MKHNLALIVALSLLACQTSPVVAQDAQKMTLCEYRKLCLENESACRDLLGKGIAGWWVAGALPECVITEDPVTKASPELTVPQAVDRLIAAFDRGDVTEDQGKGAAGHRKRHRLTTNPGDINHP